MSELALFTRAGWPKELRILAETFPRAEWTDHRNLGPIARLWLERHDMFRALGGAIATSAEEFREGRTEASAFLPWFAPRFDFFLRELHAHHQIEDHHYFPAFRKADARLSRGFDVLDADHHTIDGLIHQMARSAGALQDALTAGGDVPGASATLAEALQRAVAGLTQHLDDEEDLVIPLILERTEGGLGVG